jgi:hypothetical protein
VKRLHAGELRLPDLHILHALLFECLDWKTGRCAPTYDDLAEKTGHARDTIAGALARLAKAGILERLRRFQRVEGADGKGPQVVQAPNAYRFALPARLRLLLGLVRGATADPRRRLLRRAGRASIQGQDAHRGNRATEPRICARPAAAGGLATRVQ